MKDQQLSERVWARTELCNQVIEIGGQRLEPDETKAYCEFRLGHGFTKASPSVTAYGTAFHPGTVANSFGSLLHQVFDLGHKIRSYDLSAEKKEIPRDFILGTIVGVEYPKAPAEGWSVNLNSAPSIRAAAVIHKQAEKVPQVLGEHLGGRHKWTVSMELDYSFLQSGFVVGNKPEWNANQVMFLKETTPREFDVLGLGYVEVESAPDDLIDTFNFKKTRIDKPWGKAPVTLMKGGVNGQVHFKGVGLVRYGAEKEAMVESILASDPDRMEEVGIWEEAGIEVLKGYFQGIAKGAGALSTG